MNNSRRFIALIGIGWVLLFALIFFNRDRINLLYYLPIFLLLKLFFINTRFVSGYATLVRQESKSYWFLPVVMEHSIFSPRYSKITNISFGLVALMGIFLYLLMGLNIEIPGVDAANIERFTQNVIYIGIFLWAFYCFFIVGMGYIEIDMYIEGQYRKNFPIYKKNISRRWNVVLYFVPIIRAYPMLEAANKCDKLNKFYNVRAHEGREDLT